MPCSCALLLLLRLIGEVAVAGGGLGMRYVYWLGCLFFPEAVRRARQYRQQGRFACGVRLTTHHPRQDSFPCPCVTFSGRDLEDWTRVHWVPVKGMMRCWTAWRS